MATAKHVTPVTIERVVRVTHGRVCPSCELRVPARQMGPHGICRACEQEQARESAPLYRDNRGISIWR